jgi:hypothetical protein
MKEEYQYWRKMERSRINDIIKKFKNQYNLEESKITPRKYKNEMKRKIKK